MDNFKKEIRNSFLVFGVIIVGFSVFMFFAKGQILKLSSRVSAVQGDISQQRTIASQLVNLREDKELAEKYEIVIGDLIPTERQLFELQKWLVAQAQSHEVGIDFNYPGGGLAPVEGALGVQPFSMKLSGGLGNLVNFMDFLENKTGRFLMSFDDISVGVSRDGVNQVSLNGKVYFTANE